MLNLNRRKKAITLLKRVTLYQTDLLKSNYSHDIVRESVPVLWFGNPTSKNWLTIATNPSTREFLDKDDNVLFGDKARFFVRNSEVTLEYYANDESQLEATLNSYSSYFKSKTAYRNWFGRPNGAKLEGFLNGMGGSLYCLKTYHDVIHTDFFPLATTNQMSRISNRGELLDLSLTKEVLQEVLEIVAPSLIFILGKAHCERFESLEQGINFESTKSVSQFPNAKCQFGFHNRFMVPIIGLHFKPSEQFIGLGGGKDRNGMSHGKYATKNALNIIGKEIITELKILFPDFE